MRGYAGKILYVDLGSGTFTTEALDKDIAKGFLGGYGLGAHVLYHQMLPGTPALAEGSYIGFVTGPLNGSNALYGGRYTVVCKSPVTGGWNDANSAGFFGKKLKHSGFDAVFVTGKAKEPVYIFIDRGKVSIESAKDVWGKTTKETEAFFAKRHGGSVGAAVIGPAGENLSGIAAVMNDGHRAAARGGPGAVMGSKNLKAVVVKGGKRTWSAHPLKVLKLDLECLLYMWKQMKLYPDMKEFPKYGTGGSYRTSVEMSDAGIQNWAGAPGDSTAPNGGYSGEDAEKLSSQGLEKYKVKRYHCTKCPVGCSSFITVKTDRWGKIVSTRPEYETMGAFGSMMLNKDVESVILANELCNEYGFDTMSAGSTIAWAMECYAQGELTREDLDGIALSWGNGGAIIEILRKMGQFEGVGKILAKGSREAARVFKEQKGEAFKGEEYLVTAAGIEQPQHDARLTYSFGRTYTADPTPGRHVKAYIEGATTEPGFDPKSSMEHTGPEDVRAIVQTELMNSSGSCAFGFGYGNPRDAVLRTVNAVTGFDYSMDEFTQLGIRIFTMRQAFNLREGIRRGDINLSKRMKQGKPPYVGSLANISLDFDRMIDSLYDALGWSRDGVPSLRALTDLNGTNEEWMREVITDLYPNADGDTTAAAPKGGKRRENTFTYFAGRSAK